MKRREDIELERVLAHSRIISNTDAEKALFVVVQEKKRKALDDAYWVFVQADLELHNHKFKREQDRYVADSDGNIVTRREQ